MSIRTVIIDAIERVAREQHKTLAPLDDDAALLSIGLDSLCFAILTARLEESLNVDPFGMSDDFEVPTTLGDFIRLYDRALV